MTECTSYKIIMDYMPEKIRQAMAKISKNEQENVNEIRMLSGRAVAFVYPEKICFLTSNGLSANFRNTSAIISDYGDILKTVDSLSHYSLHSCSRELQNGFFMINNGVRVGISGRYSANGLITEIMGLNFRVSRNVPGSADKIYNVISGEKSGVLICGAVNSGKTTVLRDLCRLVGNRQKVTLIDERNEISFFHNGVPQNDIGALTDVLVGCRRAEGINSAVRVLSPDYIFCDEISTDDDATAISSGKGCGVNFCSTIHARNFNDLTKRTIAEKIIPMFRYAVFLKGAESPGEIAEIRRLDL